MQGQKAQVTQKRIPYSNLQESKLLTFEILNKIQLRSESDILEKERLKT